MFRYRAGLAYVSWSIQRCNSEKFHMTGKFTDYRTDFIRRNKEDFSEWQYVNIYACM